MTDDDRVEAAAIDAVRRDRAWIVDTLQQLVAIPSLTGDEDAVQDRLAVWLADDGLRVDRADADPEIAAQDPEWPGSEVARSTLPIVAGTLPSDRPGPRLLLVGHVDVVPPGDLETWTSPPFEPRVSDGSVYGRGACDMKGGLVAAWAAVRAFASAVPEGQRTGEVVLLCVPSEEDGGQGALAAIRAGFTGDACVIPEPTRLEIVTAHAGAITFRLTVPGRAAHASVRREGVSALDGLAVLLSALAADEERRNAAESMPRMHALGLPYPTIVGTISGGEWASTVMDRVVVHGRYGVRAGQDASGAEQELRRAIEEACAADPWLSENPATVEITGGRFSSGTLRDDHPLPSAIADAAFAALGRRPASVGVPYGADMRLFLQQGGTPTVCYGPGDVRVAHAADEHVPIDEVVDCAATLAVWLVRSLGASAA
jgi:acetylornithine deacetylase